MSDLLIQIIDDCDIKNFPSGHSEATPLPGNQIMFHNAVWPAYMHDGNTIVSAGKKQYVIRTEIILWVELI